MGLPYAFLYTNNEFVLFLEVLFAIYNLIWWLIYLLFDNYWMVNETPLFRLTIFSLWLSHSSSYHYLSLLRVVFFCFGPQHPLKVNPSSFIARLAGRVCCLSLSFWFSYLANCCRCRCRRPSLLFAFLSYIKPKAKHCNYELRWSCCLPLMMIIAMMKSAQRRVCNLKHHRCRPFLFLLQLRISEAL